MGCRAYDGIVVNIPIKNLYFLFCYAWDLFPYGGTVDVGSTQADNILDLLSQALCRIVNRCFRRGLHQDYIVQSSELKTIRGRVDVSEIIKRNSRLSCYIYCSHDEFTRNNIYNIILISTIYRLLKTDGVDPVTLESLHTAFNMLGDVRIVRLNKDHFREATIHRNVAIYGIAIKICEMIFDITIPDQFGQGYKFYDITKDQVKLSKLFESFLRNFYIKHLEGFDVGRSDILWNNSHNCQDSISILPKMRTDIALKSHSRVVIVDAKFYKNIFQTNQYGKKTLNSANLYQMFAYVENYKSCRCGDCCVEGLLIYPLVRDCVNAVYNFNGNIYRVKTIDLNQDWNLIHDQLINMI